MDTLFGILAVFALVFMNGFFVAAEFAFVGARRTRIAQLADEGSAAARSAQKAISHLDSYIAATQLGITLASLGLGWIGEPAIAHLFEPMFHAFLPKETVESIGRPVAIAISFALVTMLHIVLGELAPKAIALQRPEDTALLVARPTTLFHNLFRPVIALMNGIGNAVVRLLGFEPAGEHARVHSAEELEMLVHSSREAGLLQESEERLLRRVFDFSDIDIEAVMQPRVEVEALDIQTPLTELLKQVSASHYSRYPAYEDQIDRVVGVLYVKDLLDALVRQPELLTSGAADFQLGSILRTPLYIPATVSVDKVLEKMQRSQTHVAIVIDEYGGMAGLATMEDIIEQIVGDVLDEFDTEADSTGTKAAADIVDGLTNVSELVERFGEPDIDTESTTIGGYIAERLERIPLLGDKVAFGDYDLYVVEMDGMRVARVRFARRVPMPPISGDGETSP